MDESMEVKLKSASKRVETVRKIQRVLCEKIST